MVAMVDKIEVDISGLKVVIEEIGKGQRAVIEAEARLTKLSRRLSLQNFAWSMAGTVIGGLIIGAVWKALGL